MNSNLEDYMASTRKQKIARLLREELSSIIRREINDPRLGFISITDIELSADIQIANVYISAFGTPEEQQDSMAVLERAAGFLRGVLGHTVELRHIPLLRFHLDTSLERGARVFALLNEIEPGLKEEDTHEQS
jgi:ribosome-binding factor A